MSAMMVLFSTLAAGLYLGLVRPGERDFVGIGGKGAA
jgi:hypothetical protein